MSEAPTFWLSVAPTRDSKRWENRKITWNDLVERCRAPLLTGETMAEYKAMTKDEQAVIKDVGGFVGGSINGGRRLLNSVASRSLITLDIDLADTTFWERFTLFYGCTALCYSTHSHTPQNPRLRLIIPLADEIPTDQYGAIARRIAGDLDIEIFDNVSFRLHQLMYWPSIPKDGVFYFKMQEGPLLAPSSVLGRYANWKDSSQWPTSVKVSEAVRNGITKQGDPTTKPGIIGAFCRIYDVPGAIKTFLKDIYKETDDKSRYTYINGSAAGGLVIYDNGMFAYSHHGTDPISEKLVNAFDIVRIHKFGHLDSGTSSTTHINRRPSFVEMLSYAAKDTEVSLLLTTEVSDIFGHWTNDEKEFLAKLEKDRRGVCLSTIENCSMILANDPNLKMCFGYDTFRNTNTILRPLPWRLDAIAGEPIIDTDYDGLYEYLEINYKICVTTKIDISFRNTFIKYRFHPVREYLESVTWDGAKRLESVLIDYFGAEDSNYVRMVTRKTFAAAVARIYRPGTKFDHFLIMISDEGKNKSSFIEKMGRGWSSADFGPLNDMVRAMEQLRGVWLMEVGELAGLRKSDADTVKLFLSKTSDQYRKAYGREKGVYPRQVIFIGNSNRRDFITDGDENRRMWPVQLHVTKPTKDMWLELDDEIDQLWAEAKSLWKAGERLYLTEDEKGEAIEVRRGHREQDIRAMAIPPYLDMQLPEKWDSMDTFARRDYMTDPNRQLVEGIKPRHKVSVMDIWVDVIRGREIDATPSTVKFIRNFMDQHPEWESRIIFISGKSTRGYYRKPQNYIDKSGKFVTL